MGQSTHTIKCCCKNIEVMEDIVRYRLLADVSKDCNVFSFRVKQYENSGSAGPLSMKALQFFEASVTFYQQTRRNTLEDLNLLHHWYENHKSPIITTRFTKSSCNARLCLSCSHRKFYCEFALSCMWRCSLSWAQATSLLSVDLNHRHRHRDISTQTQRHKHTDTHTDTHTHTHTHTQYDNIHYTMFQIHESNTWGYVENMINFLICFFN